MRTSLLIFAWSACLIPVSALAGPVGTNDDECVVFYGDKLVYPPHFSRIVEAFVRVKYPEAKSKFWHVGTREFDKTPKANEDFVARVAKLKPDTIVLSWGMGDGEMKKADDARLANFASEYGKLIDKCKALTPNVFALTPPCPTISKKNVLAINEYDKTVGKIAEAIRKVGAERGITVLDWYTPTAAIHEAGEGEPLTDKNGMYPAGPSDAIAAKLIMDAWKLEPLDVRVTLDWVAGEVSTTHGKAQLSKGPGNGYTLLLTDFPMPLYTGKRDAAFSEKLACADYCRITLESPNLPEGKLAMRERGTRRRPMIVPSRVVRAGYNLAVRSPLLASSDFRTLVDRIEDKNAAFFNIANFQRQFIDNPKIEPELTESYRLHHRALEVFHEGMMKLLERTPRTIDIAIEMQVSSK